MTPLPGFGGAVLAGGRSSRMGRDKAFVEVNGEALIAKAAAALVRAGADDVVAVGGDESRISALGLSHAVDLWPGEGPLGGIVTALRAINSEIVVVLSCDLTSPSPDAIRQVVTALDRADVAVPVVENRAQWMHAAWSRRCLPALDAAFVAGDRAPHVVAATLAVATVEGADARWFHDADTPEDLDVGAD